MSHYCMPLLSQPAGFYDAPCDSTTYEILLCVVRTNSNRVLAELGQQLVVEYLLQTHVLPLRLRYLFAGPANSPTKLLYLPLVAANVLGTVLELVVNTFQRSPKHFSLLHDHLSGFVTISPEPSCCRQNSPSPCLPPQRDGPRWASC